jgi:predicted ABC-type ATPase
MDNERMAQIVADFLRKKLLAERKKFSFETVFSHPSKLEIMRQAAAAGYKVYLYFVSTESPLINEFRVKARVAKGGHHVPVDKIESRYYRSLDLLFEASQIAYQAYYFDNSKEGEDFTMFAHFKVVKNKKKWDRIDPDTVPSWFKKYYSQKIHR